MSKITTLSEVQTETKDTFWSEVIPIEKTMIEVNLCPKCRRNLTYQGFAKLTEARAYGVCKPCNFAKMFWQTSYEISNFKKKICAMSAK